MRNPYVVGRWVRGTSHYGRQALIDHLLHNTNTALWVVGTRRIGKTSLLRQIEFLTQGQSPFVPLFFDLQGVGTAEECNQELYYALEDTADRFAALGMSVAALADEDAATVLRILRRAATAADRQLLLLIDEPEALISLVKADTAYVQRLYKVMMASPGIRVIMASTKGLLRLNDQASAWPTSPFLIAFAPRNLAGLDAASTAQLIRQEQSDRPVAASPELVGQIRQVTGDHPYLVQILCQRLWQENDSLRDVTPADLLVDDMLSGFFFNDFGTLSPGERRILLAVSQERLMQHEALRPATGLPEADVTGFVYSLIKLGYLRVVDSQLMVNNVFLDTWLDNNRTRLQLALDSGVPDATSARMIEVARHQERGYLSEQLAQLKRRLAELESQQAAAGVPLPPQWIEETDHLTSEVERLTRLLSAVDSGLTRAYPEANLQASVLKFD